MTNAALLFALQLVSGNGLSKLRNTTEEVAQSTDIGTQIDELIAHLHQFLSVGGAADGAGELAVLLGSVSDLLEAGDNVRVAAVAGVADAVGKICKDSGPYASRSCQGGLVTLVSQVKNGCW